MSSHINRPSRSGPPQPNGVGPCPKTLKSILRRKLCYQLASSSTSSVDSTSSCRSVKFNEAVDEHQADEWDRSSCAVACPTSRDIWELKKIQRELLPNGCGVIQDDRDGSSCVEEEYYFDLFGDDDVDCSQRLPPRRPKRLLNKIPVELCPLLPSAGPDLLSTPTTPNNSVSPSPLDSPPHGSPVLAPVKVEEPTKNKRGGPMMKFQPLLPPTPPPTAIKGGSSVNSSNIPTPPQTPTFSDRELPSLTDAPSMFLPCGPAPITHAKPHTIVTQQQQQPPSVVKDVPSIHLSPSSPSPEPPSMHRLTLLPVLPSRTSTPPRPASSPSTPSLWSSPGVRATPIPTMMKTGGSATSASSPTTVAPGFMPFTVSFKATGRI